MTNDPHPGAVYALLANGVLATHVALAVFVVAGLPAVWIGNALGWRRVNDRRFRIAHVAAIVFIAAEAWFGTVCPLTTAEMWLRARAGVATYDGDFVAHWLHRLLYYDAPPWVFVVAYTAFGIAVLATWWWLPPRRRGADVVR